MSDKGIANNSHHNSFTSRSTPRRRSVNFDLPESTSLWLEKDPFENLILGQEQKNSAVRRSVESFRAFSCCSVQLYQSCQLGALARFATKWEAKTRSMCMFLESNSVCMDLLKHLQMSKWPCLEFIVCQGKYGNALPVSWVLGESSANIQCFVMSQCSLAVVALQSLVTTCPHLCNVSLTGCKIDAAALACLSQARFSRLDNLSISTSPLGWPTVQSLSSCDLPALQCLALGNTNLSALAAMHLAQGCWPNLTYLNLYDNQLNVEAVAYLIKGKWPLLQMLSLMDMCA